MQCALPVIVPVTEIFQVHTFVEYRAEVIDHKVQWQKKFEFECTMVANAITAVLEPCNCRVSVRKVKEFDMSEV